MLLELVYQALFQLCRLGHFFVGLLLLINFDFFLRLPVFVVLELFASHRKLRLQFALLLK